MSKFCPKCGRENLEESSFCANCGYDFKKLNDILKEEPKTEKKFEISKKNNLNTSFNWKNILIIFLIIVIIGLIALTVSGNTNENISTQNNQISSDNIVSEEFSDINDSSFENVKTHNFNYANKANFNISDSLTDKTEVKSIIFGQGVSYKYSDGSVCNLGGLASYGGSDDLEYRQNDAYIEEIGKYHTPQGYDGYIFKYDSSENYDVLIDLDNMTIVEADGFESEYDYFWATFHSLNESKTFINTFKLNESVIK